MQSGFLKLKKLKKNQRKNPWKNQRKKQVMNPMKNPVVNPAKKLVTMVLKTNNNKNKRTEKFSRFFLYLFLFYVINAFKPFFT